MTEIYNIIQSLNWQMIVAMFLIGLYYTRDLRNFITKIEERVEAQSARSDKLYEMFCTLQKEMKDELLTLKTEHYKFMQDNKK